MGMQEAGGSGSGLPGNGFILGVDTSLRSTGLGLIETRGSRLTLVEQAVVRHPAAWPLSRCLASLYGAVADMLARRRPGAAALEGVFFCKNVRTAVVLGEARGAVIAACARAAVPVFEHSPRRVKQAVSGSGAAGKGQVGRMVAAMLGLASAPPEDAADALAIAICHAHAGRYATLSDARGI